MDLCSGWKTARLPEAVAWNFLAEERFAASIEHLISLFPAQRRGLLMGGQRIRSGIHHTECRPLKNFLHYVSKLAFNRG
jgi:hypothetical protein